MLVPRLRGPGQQSMTSPPHPFSNASPTLMSDSSSLTSWVKNNFAPLYEANSNTLGTDFDRSFESVFAPGAEIVVNHNSITRDELKKNMQERSFAATRGSIEWKDLIEISSGDSSSEVRQAFATSYCGTSLLVKDGNCSRIVHRDQITQVQNSCSTSADEQPNYFQCEVCMSRLSSLAPLLLNDAIKDRTGSLSGRGRSA
jgi:hypothetical protein